jgi:hypothetical protein
MDRESMAAALGGGPGTEHLMEGWAASQVALPADGQVFFLDPA